MGIIGSIKVEGMDMYAGDIYQGVSRVKVVIPFNIAELGGGKIYRIRVSVDKEIAFAQSYLLGTTSQVVLNLPTDKYSNVYFPTIKVEAYTTLIFGGVDDAKSVDARLYIRKYELPKVLSTLVNRTNSVGKEDSVGAYVTAVITPQVYQGSNIYHNSVKDVKIYTKIRGDDADPFKLAYSNSSGILTATFGGQYDAQRGYEVKVVITDLLGGQDTCLDFVSTGTVALELYHNTAASFGKNVEKLDGLELGEKWNLYVHENIYLDGSIISESSSLYKMNSSSYNGILISVKNLKEDDFVMISFTNFMVSKTPPCRAESATAYFCYTSGVLHAFISTHTDNSNTYLSARVNGTIGEVIAGVTAIPPGSFSYCRINDLVKSSKEIIVLSTGTKVEGGQ